jgi:hypothetical protein
MTGPVSDADEFSTLGLRLQIGEPMPVGGAWSGEGDTAGFTISARLVYDPVTMPMPGHDPPIAWRVVSGPFPLVCCPALLFDGIVVSPSLPDYLPVLDAEPGRRP